MSQIVCYSASNIQHKLDTVNPHFNGLIEIDHSLLPHTQKWKIYNFFSLHKCICIYYNWQKNADGVPATKRTNIATMDKSIVPLGCPPTYGIC